MDPRSAVAESSSRDRQDLRPDGGDMEKTVVEFVGLKRKRFHVEIGSCSVDLEEEPVVAPKLARSLVEERSAPTAPAACNVDPTLGSDPHDDDDCVITGWLTPAAALIRDSKFVIHGVLRALGADEEESSDSEYSVESVPASVSARESDDGFNSPESDDEISAPEWDADDDSCWGW